MSEKTYTTFDLAKILDVYPTTVAKWIDEQKVKAFTTPGGHRRIREEDLLRFLKEHKMPIPVELQQDGRKRVLIVDDERPVINVISKVLKKFSDKYVVSSASDGFQAGEMVHDFKPDLVILDLRLPGINGFKVCSRIKKNENTRHIKIMAITGYDTPEYRKRILKAGADDYLAKPFDINTLADKVEKLLY